MECAAAIDLSKARAWARAVAAGINHEGPPMPTFARARPNVPTVVAILGTLPSPSTNVADRVYHQLKYILGVAAEQQAKSSLQRWAKVFVSS
jgi:hypothetical protein